VPLARRPAATILLVEPACGTGTTAADEENEVKRIRLILATNCCALVIALPAVASDWKTQPMAVKRQMLSQVISCMKKRMSTDQRISYYQASKICRETVEGQLEKSTSGPLVAADTSVAK
jgi:hypothetical protein